MLYLFLSKNRLKVLAVKKTLLGQYENAFYEKKHSVEFINEQGIITNTDLLASAIKEATTTIAPHGLKDKEIYLILPQASFEFLRTEVPADIASTAVSSFVNDKMHSVVKKELESYHYDYIVQNNGDQKQIILFAMDKDLLKSYQDTLHLIDLHLVNILPESLAYFKLFEKTLRKDKRENILYAITEKDEVFGYLFDSYGPLPDTSWHETLDGKKTVETIFKTKTDEYEKQGKKLNRLILSGEASDTIRQDTFTKNVGVWTNPLKRIIPQFYQDYLKIFIIPSDKTLPLLAYDSCIGAFIFSLENKTFSLMKKRFGGFSTPSLSKPSLNVSKRELMIFVGSFLLSFLTFLLLSKIHGGSLPKIGSFMAAKPTATPTPLPPTPTPTITINRKEVKVKILNGSGVKGKASEVKDVLKNKGYEDILTGNADNFDYTTTEVQIKKSKPNLADAIKNDLKDNVPAPKITDLSEKEASDIIVIFGTDFK